MCEAGVSYAKSIPVVCFLGGDLFWIYLCFPFEFLCVCLHCFSGRVPLHAFILVFHRFLPKVSTGVFFGRGLFLGISPCEPFGLVFFMGSRLFRWYCFLWGIMDSGNSVTQFFLATDGLLKFRAYFAF